MVIADTDMGSHPAVPSCDGALIAVVDRAQLVIRLCEDGSVKQSYDLPMGFAASCRFMRWYRELETGECSPGRAMNGNWHGAGTSQRVLLADDSRIIVYDITKPQLYAEVDGATTLTKLANVDFGRTPDEIVVFSDFGSKLQIWSLGTKRAIEIKDVKSISACYSYRPKSGHLALLTRPAAHDILMIIAPQTHEQVATVELTTVDARGIRYSPDGNWLAVWDTASAGCRVLFLTADGHLFKTYSLPQEDLNLGIACVQWSPTGECVAVGDHEGKVTILVKNTFRPRVTILHQSTIDSSRGTVWQEELGHSRTRSYTEAKQFAVSPSCESFPSAKEKSPGTMLLEFNIDGSLLACKCNYTPSTVRIFSAGSGQPLGTLIHHAPVRSIQWHNDLADVILIQCAIPGPTVYVWRASWNSPRIFSLSIKAPFGKLKASWLSADRERIRYILSNTEQYAIGQFTADGEEIPWGSSEEFPDGLGPEDMFDEGHSLDMSPVKIPDDGGIANDTPAPGLSTQLGFTSVVEDTFHFRR